MEGAKPHFFQPLLQDFHQGLLIPVAFLKYLNLNEKANGSDSHNAVLRTECGEWKVKIKGRRFEDGWTSFAKHHDFHVGDFVVFEYHGDLVFYVSVFGPNACKRQYYSNNCVKPEPDMPLPNNTNHRSRDECHQPVVAARLEPEATTTPMQLYPSFRAVLRDIRRPEFYLPRGFARSHGLSDRHVLIVDGDHHDRKSWQVKLSKSSGRKTQYYVSKGWKDFRVANALKVGDNFSFTLIENGKMPVMVFNKIKETCSEVKKGPVEEVTAQYFTSEISSYILKHSGLYMPVNFAKSNGLSKSCEVTIIDPEQRQWVVGVRCNNVDGSLRFQQGWRSVAIANNLKVGDVIKLERVGGRKSFAMNLSIM